MDDYMTWERGRTWYRVDGDIGGARPPVVLLHGGPGAPSDYLEPIAEALGDAGWAAVSYDQIGCGRSDHFPDADPSFWTVDLFKHELALLIELLGIDDGYFLLGQSWGGMLAMEHALERPSGLLGMVVANSPASIPLWVEEANRLRRDLPPEIQQTLLEHEANGTTDSDEYETAMMAFYDRYVCRIPWPEPLQRTFTQLTEDPTVYNTMNGPSEFHVVGAIKDWDITDRLHEIDVPTLLISGRHDEATPRIVEEIHERIRGSEWVLIEDASHSTHLEKPDEFMAAVVSFLDRVTASAGSRS